MWGVDDVIPDYSYLTILRATQEPLVENIPIPNGSGVQAGRVDVISGFTLNVTLRDDRRMSALHIGDQVTIVDMGGLLPGRLRGETCTGYVRSPNFEGAAKQAGEKVVVLEYLSLVEGAGL